jgi:CheY-like chemotaxis protein
MTAELLQSCGQIVYQARDGYEAIELAAAERPDVILLDLGMPGLDGFDTAERVRELMGDETPPLVALSGFGAESDRQRTDAAKFAAHLVKPIDPDALIATLLSASSRTEQQ